MEAIATLVGLLYFAVLVYMVTLVVRFVCAFERIASATERAADTYAHK